MDKIREMRQPMVTATGIFLGFVLNFMSQWITTAFTKNIQRDFIISISFTTCLGLLLSVLFRTLRASFVAKDPDRFYKTTLLLFLIGISIPFLSFVIIIVEKLMGNNV